MFRRREFYTTVTELNALAAAESVNIVNIYSKVKYWY